MLELSNSVLAALAHNPGNEGCSAVLELLLEASASRLGYFGRLEDDGVLVCAVGGVDARPAGGRLARIPGREWPAIWRSCLEQGEPVCANSVSVPAPSVPVTLRRALVVPVCDGADRRGLLCLANRENPYSAAELRRIAAAVQCLGPVLSAWCDQERAEARRRDLERRLKLTQFAIDHSPGVVLTLDPSGRIVYANKTACRTLGYRAEELTRKNIRELLEDGSRRCWERFRDELSKPAALECEARFRTSAGSPIPFSVLAGRLEFDGLELIALVCRDISDYVAAREELLQALEKEREATRLKSEFLANVNHELRTPLNAIIGMTELLLESPLSGEQREYVETVHRASHDLLEMIEDILDLEKVEAGKLELRPETFDPQKLVDNVAGLFAKSAREKGIEIAVACDPALPPSLVGDSSRIRQVLVNLVSNAVKFTPSGHVTIRAECLGWRDSRAQIRFAVEDSGIGIPGDKREMIFERFSQVDGSPTRSHEGVGLGLAIVKDLVELMGGELGVDSEVGRGSTFWLTLWLPAAAERSLGPAEPAAAEPAPGGGRRWDHAPRVLVAEDDAVNRKVAVRLLERLGCVVDAVADGRQAAELAAERDYDLVFMDCEMPVMDGCQAARRIRREPGPKSQVPIIAMTARVMKGDIEACLAAGMDDYVRKPVHLRDFRVVLEKWVRRETGLCAVPGIGHPGQTGPRSCGEDSGAG